MINYDQYLGSAKWAGKRHLVRTRCGGKCEICGKTMEHVHHLTYARMGRELQEDLQGLCADCHEDAHPDRKRKRRRTDGEWVELPEAALKLGVDIQDLQRLLANAGLFDTFDDTPLKKAREKGFFKDGPSGLWNMQAVASLKRRRKDDACRTYWLDRNAYPSEDIACGLEVRRKTWADDGSDRLHAVSVPRSDYPMVATFLKDDGETGCSPYTPTPDDLAATDWQVAAAFECRSCGKPFVFPPSCGNAYGRCACGGVVEEL